MGYPPQPMPTTKGQQNLNRSLVVGAGNYPITGCAREHEFSRFLPSPWKKLAPTTDATWIGRDWIDQSQWLTKQQKDRDRVTGVEQTQSNPECPPPSPPPPPHHPHLFTAVHPSPVAYQPWAWVSDLCDYLSGKLLLSSQPSLSGNVNQEQLHEVWFTVKY